MSKIHLPIFVCAISLLALPALAGVSPENEKSAEGVRAVEAHWTQAFLTGDADYLGVLLDPDYVSVNEKGVARPKDAIIALSKKIAAIQGQNPPTPSHLTVSVEGDAAIVTDFETTSTSVDVFHYCGGTWHAWYSQHTAVAQAAP
jgi:ketosteroid isomerase-like protein